MEKLTPVGAYILVKTLPVETITVGSELKLVDQTFQNVEVVENSEQFYSIYKKGDILKISQSVGQLQRYNGDNCLWINGKGYGDGGDVWAIITESKSKK